MKYTCYNCPYTIECPKIPGKTQPAKYKSGRTTCSKMCPNGWHCSRPEGHKGEHEAHSGHKASEGALALWKYNENLARLE